MRITTLALCAAFVAVASPALAQRTAVIAPGAGVTATLSPAIRLGDMLYVSGTLGRKQGSPMDSTVQGQTKQVLENIKALVEAAGSKMEMVVKCTVFLTDLKDFQGMNSVYSTYWPKDPPARSTVVVAALVAAGAKVEIECIAGVPKS